MQRLKEKALPAQDYLATILRYEPSTGKLFWRRRTLEMFAASEHKTAEMACRFWNSKYADKEALTALCNGHKRGIIDGQMVYSHRVIWKWMTGEEPPEIDHVDRVPTNNRWTNLRAATRGLNSRNMPRRSDNISGVVGVHFDKRRKYWIAQISVRGRETHLGVYPTKEPAAAARKAAEDIYDFHPNHGRDPA
jgi:hypothetical protein